MQRDPNWALEARSPVSDIYSREYNMNHPRRGVALILNHINFEVEETREGSDKDCARLKRVLRKLGFDVRVETDLPFDKVLQVLRSCESLL
jgi:caspase 7